MENYGNVVFPFTEFPISYPMNGITTFATTIKTISQSFSTAGWWFFAISLNMSSSVGMMKFPYGKNIFQTTNQNFGIMNIGGLPSQQLDTKKAKKCEQWLDFEVVIQFEHIDKLYIH